MDPVYKLIIEFATAVGLTPACVIALIALFMQYRQLTAKDKVIETMSHALKSNTEAVIQIKTIFEAFLIRGGVQ